MSDWRGEAYHAQQDAERAWVEEGAAEAEAQADMPDAAKMWRVRMICCGTDDGVRDFDSWETADRFRNAYTGDGNMGSLALKEGHKRTGIIESLSPFLPLDIEANP